MGVGTLRRRQRGGFSDGRQRGRDGVVDLRSVVIRNVLHLD